MFQEYTDQECLCYTRPHTVEPQFRKFFIHTEEVEEVVERRLWILIFYYLDVYFPWTQGSIV